MITEEGEPVAQRRAERQIKGRVEFVGLGDGEEAPSLALRLVDAAGKTIESTEIGGEGSFEISADALGKAERVLIGPQTQIRSQPRRADSTTQGFFSPSPQRYNRRVVGDKILR
jgi:hypothetical protein